MNNKSIKYKTAIFPVAGFGSRFLPATKASPKEMLPVIDKPLIQYSVEEAYNSGIRHIIFVTGRNKRSIEDHFDDNPELRRSLELDKKDELLMKINSIAPKDLKFSYVRQANPRGLGHAILCAQHLVFDDFFSIILPDDLLIQNPPSLYEMVKICEDKNANVIAIREVDEKIIHKYGVISSDNYLNEPISITDLVEKPKKEYAPSNLAVTGRYVLSNQIFKHLENQQTGFGGEIQLTDAIKKLLIDQKLIGYKFPGKLYDCGSKIGFLQATVDLACEHKELGDEFSEWLKNKF